MTPMFSCRNRVGVKLPVYFRNRVGVKLPVYFTPTLFVPNVVNFGDWHASKDIR